MTKYKFPDFNIEIVNPTINVSNVSDNIQEKKCVVSILMVDDSESKFGFIFPNSFNYVETWDDSEIVEWVNQELTKYIM